MEIRIVIVGSGGTGRHHAERFSQLEGVRIAYIASRNVQTGTELAQRVGATYIQDWREAVGRDDVDGVVVCTHNDSHGPIALTAVRADKHVLMEYPLARRMEEGEAIVEEVRRRAVVFRLTHSETLSPLHDALREAVQRSGSLLLSEFRRLTPGRGARPEILFNIPVSGPPTHFFVYHIYPAIDLFGPVRWVFGAAQYENLRDDGRYDAFVNTVSVEFLRGGIGQWTWAGGIAIDRPEQLVRYVLSEATLRSVEGGWERVTRGQVGRVLPKDRTYPTHQERWLDEIRRGDSTAGHRDLETALEAIRVSLNAERSMEEGKRIVVHVE